jgi:hypothetical protein
MDITVAAITEIVSFALDLPVEKSAAAASVFASDGDETGARPQVQELDIVLIGTERRRAHNSLPRDAPSAGICTEKRRQR